MLPCRMIFVEESLQNTFFTHNVGGQVLSLMCEQEEPMLGKPNRMGTSRLLIGGEQSKMQLTFCLIRYDSLLYITHSAGAPWTIVQINEKVHGGSKKL